MMPTVLPSRPILGLALLLVAAAAAEIGTTGAVAQQQLDQALQIAVEAREKKSVQDEESIRAIENFEFQYLPESSANYGYYPQLLNDEPVASASHDDHEHHHPKVGYSVGGPLVNIAQGAAAQAHTFERNQPAAAAQAAYVAKNRLGQSAGLSAATAAAAFAGKQIILRGLEQQTYNAHRALEGEKLQLQQAKRAATAASGAAQQAMQQLQMITTALNAAQATSQQASAAAAEAAAELAAQTAMVGAAKARLQALEEQLHHARVDFEAAQRANLKAAAAARSAQNNAAAAAAHAAEVASRREDHHHHHHHHHDDGHSQHHSNLEAPGEEEAEEEEADGEEDHERRESVAVTVASEGLPTPTTLPTTRLEPAGRRGSVPTPPDYSANSAGVSTEAKDELYDAYDSFPY